MWQPCELLYTCYLLTYLLTIPVQRAARKLCIPARRRTTFQTQRRVSAPPRRASRRPLGPTGVNLAQILGGPESEHLRCNPTQSHRIKGRVEVGTGEHPVAGTRKVKTNLDFTEARDSEWQWHQLGHMQTDNHVSTPLLSFLQRMPFLPPNQQRQSTVLFRVGYEKCRL